MAEINPCQASGLSADARHPCDRALDACQAWDHLVNAVALRIRRSLDLAEILQSTTDEIQPLLGCDRVVIYRFAPDWSGQVVTETVAHPQWSILDRVIHDPCFQASWLKPYQDNRYFALNDITQADITPCHAEFLASFHVKANLIIPILETDTLWGLLIAHHCQGARLWQAAEIEGLQLLAVQVGIAIHQARLMAELQAAKTQLESTVAARTSALAQSRDRLRDEMQRCQQLVTIVASSHDAILSTDLNGIVTSWNQGAEALFGYTAAEIIGQSLMTVIPEALQAEETQMLEHVHQGQPITSYETQRCRRDGQLIDVAITISPLRDEDGNLTGVSRIPRDISRRKQEERQRQAAEANLAESEQRLQLALEASGDGLWDWNITTGELFLSDRWGAMLGFAPGELTPNVTTWEELIHPDDRPWVEERLQAHLADPTVPYQFDYRLQTQTGDWKWIANYGKVVTWDAAGHPMRMAGTHRDISDRKQYETQIKQSEATKQALIQSIPDLLVQIRQDGLYLDVLNRDSTNVDIFAYDSNRAGAHVTEALPPDLAQQRLAYVQQVIATQQPVTYEYQIEVEGTIHDEEARLIPLDDISVLAVIRDISDRKRIEAQLRQSEATKQALIQAIPDFLVRMRQDGVQLEVINVGNVYCLHPAPAPIQRHNVLDIMPADISQERIQLAQRAIATGQTQVQEYAFTHDGRTIYEEARISPMTDDEVLVMVRDISDRKQAEHDSQANKEQLELVLKASSEGFWDWNLLTNDIYFSPRWKSMFGYADHELENTFEMWESLIFEEDRATVLQLVEDYNSGKIDTFATIQRFHHKNGSTVSVLSRAIHLKNDTGQVIRMVGSHLDLTQTMHMQEALRNSEMQLSSILDSSLDGIMAFRSIRDAQGHIIDFEWLLSNPTACQIVNKSVNELIGHHLLDVLPGNRTDGLFDLYIQVVETGNPIQRQFHYAHDGIDTWFENVAVKLGDGFAVTFRDISNIKQSEQALQQANQTLATHLDDLRQRNQEMLLLSETSDFLQACRTLEEACSVITTLVEPLFPDCSGSFHITCASRNRIEAVAQWGDRGSSKPEFQPHDCWALRRGKWHQTTPESYGLRCRHMTTTNPQLTTLCIPMIAQGETLGMFHLNSEDSQLQSESKRQLARTVAEQVGLAIANLHLRETLHNQSIRDSLTGLFNRRYLEESLQKEIARAQRHQTSVAVVMVDVDHFKAVNDTYGHDVGDIALQAIAQVLKTAIRSSDTACRYGGEEMTLVFPDTPLDEAIALAEELRLSIQHLVIKEKSQQLCDLSASFGVAVFPQHGILVPDLVRAADAALYRAKTMGRNQVVAAGFNAQEK
ncbi:PAS domain S-box protein [Leptolyngbya iicbica]|uniref:PAS domain S-box protein n=2 Tax=Cyanophyceae TaxID=3028117 RepID=A0A4Q7EIK6_9CYAN|nr:PAS domain S-box protein [Leptolyngbya sp. LK]RZM82908.1 PAS domain S-box protein [Leptolyngbya sp. LK]